MKINKRNNHASNVGKSEDSQLNLVKQEFRDAKDYSSEYQQSDTPIAHFFNTRLKRVSELLDDFESGRILDVGCGPGKIGNAFRGRSIKYHGVDISEDMINECIDTFGDDPQFSFSIGKIEELQFPDSSFDVVLCLGALEYVLDSQVAICEIARVLKPRGIVIVTMHNGMSPYRVWQRYVYWKLKNGINKLMRLIIKTRNDQGTKSFIKPKFRVHSETSLRHLLNSEGLEIEEVVYYDFNLFFAPLDAMFPRAAVLTSRKFEFLCRSKLKFIGTGFMLKCRKK